MARELFSPSRGLERARTRKRALHTPMAYANEPFMFVVGDYCVLLFDSQVANGLIL